MRVTDRGRAIAKDKGARKATPLSAVLAEVPAYRAIIDRAVHKGELTVTATEAGAHWHQYFRSDASDSDEILNQQAICFFQLCEGADLGRLIVGRKGQPTRFEFDEARTFVDGSEAPVDAPVAEPMHLNGEDVSATKLTAVAPLVALINRIFVTHGKKTKILEQIKRTVTSVGLEPVGARLGKPSCSAAYVTSSIASALSRTGRSVAISFFANPDALRHQRVVLLPTRRRAWRFHEGVIQRLRTRLIFCIGVRTGKAIRQHTVRTSSQRQVRGPTIRQHIPAAFGVLPPTLIQPSAAGRSAETNC